MAVRFISHKEVLSFLTLEKTIEVVEKAFAEHAHGRTVAPPVLSLPVTSQRGEIDIKVCYVDDLRVAGGKAVSFYEGNPDKGLPSVLATIVLFNGETGELLAVLDGTYITTARTGALGALSAKYLARGDARTVGVIGAGTQARIQLEALKVVKPQISAVRVFSRTPSNTQRYATEMQSKLDIPVNVVGSVREAVEGADIIITATNAREPLVNDAWLSPGALIVDIGADGEGMQELDPAIFERARAFCDSLDQCAAIGELQHPLEAGIITREQVTEIGDVFIGKAPGRLNDDEIIVFDSTGVAIQDVAVGHLVYQLAEASSRPSMRFLGETLDDLACAMMARQDWPPRDELHRCYQAARQHAGGAPVTWEMGKGLLRATAENKTVILVTGEYEREVFDKGESDGPVGIAVLARVLHRLGCRLVFVCNPLLFDVHRAIVDAFAGTPLEYVAFSGGAEFDYESLAAEILEEYDPAAIIACEKLGRNIAGEYHDAGGTNCSLDQNRVDFLFDLAYEQERLTIAFGDHCNEIGYGSIYDVAVDASPWGRTCLCPCGKGTIAITKVTYLLPTTVSNWGAIALADMLAALSGRIDLVHTAGRQRWLQELIIENEVVDGATLKVSRSVDGIDGDVDLAVVKVMEAATTRSLTKRQISS